MLETFVIQAAKAALYYLGLIVLVRLAGKRMAGQTTTFDLLVLITLGVVMQSAALAEGAANAAVFIATVFGLQRLALVFFGKPKAGLVAGAVAALVHAELEFWHTAQPETFGGYLGVGYQLEKSFQVYSVVSLLAWMFFFVIFVILVERFLIAPAERRVFAWRDPASVRQEQE